MEPLSKCYHIMQCSICFSASLYLSLSLSLFASLCLSVSVSLCLSLPLFASHCLCFSLSHFASLCLSLPLSASLLLFCRCLMTICTVLCTWHLDLLNL